MQMIGHEAGSDQGTAFQGTWQLPIGAYILCVIEHVLYLI